MTGKIIRWRLRGTRLLLTVRWRRAGRGGAGRGEKAKNFLTDSDSGFGE